MKRVMITIGFTSVCLLGVITGCAAPSRHLQAATDHLQAVTDQSFSKIALCTLLANPKAYAGKSLEIVARVTATKEGIDVWDPACGAVGIDLSIDFDSHGEGFTEFQKALREHGLSDHPVVATVRGIFLLDQYEKIRHQKRSIIKVDSVVGIHQSQDMEQRSVDVPTT